MLIQHVCNSGFYVCVDAGRLSAGHIAARRQGPARCVFTGVAASTTNFNRHTVAARTFLALRRAESTKLVASEPGSSAKVCVAISAQASRPQMAVDPSY